MTRKDLIGLAVLGLAVAGIQLALLEIPWPSDPMFGYMNGATVFSGAGEEMQGLPQSSLQPHHRFLRLGLVGTVAGLQSLFGYSQFAYYGVGLVSVVAVAVLTAVLARRTLPSFAALAAGGLAVLNPIVLHWSSHPQPDLYMTAWLLVGVVLIPRSSEGVRYGGVRILLAGVAWAMAWTVKETAPLLFAPVALAALWVSRAKLRDWLLVIAGAVAVLLVETAVLWQQLGTPLARLDALLSRGTDPSGVVLDSRQVARRARLLVQQDSVVDSLWLWVLNLRSASLPMQLLLFAPVGAAIGSVRFRRSWWVVVAAWSVWPWLFYGLLGPARLSSGAVTIPLSNFWYWHILLPPVAIGFVGLVYFAMAWLRDESSAAIAAPIAALALIVWVWPATTGDPRMIINGQDQYAQFQDWVSGRSGVTRLASTPKTVRVLGLYETPAWGGRPRAQFLSLSNVDEEAMLAIDGWTRSDQVQWADTELSTVSPPRGFGARFVSSNGRLLVLGPSTARVEWSRLASARSDEVETWIETGQEARFAVSAEHQGEILRILVEGDLDGGRFGVTCPDGGPAGYGGQPGSMSRYSEWQFFCRPQAPSQGEAAFVVSPVGGRLTLDAVSIAKR